MLIATTVSGVAPTSAAPGEAETAAASRPAGAVVSAPPPALSVREVLRYWTPARMAAAIPLEALVSGLSPSTSDRTAGSVAERSSPARVRVPRTVGKLFFSDSGGDYVCSAAAIQTPRRNQVITAGHCVHSGPDTGFLGLFGQPHFYRNWVFVPRYHRGRTPDGRWVARKAWAFEGWTERESFKYDQAIIAFRRRNGRTLGDVVGGNEIECCKPQRRWGVRIWGWPAQEPYDGETAQRCDGRTTRFENSGDAAMRQCPLNGGASGGPWLLPRGRTRDEGRIFAVTSRRLLARPVLLAHPIPPEIRGMIRRANP